MLLPIKNYLMAKEIKKENEIDDLGFDINFGAYRPETTTVSLLQGFYFSDPPNNFIFR